MIYDTPIAENSDFMNLDATETYLHQQKYYPALCVLCASDALDAGMLMANQDTTTLPHNIQEAMEAAPNTQDTPDAAPKTEDAT